MLRIDDIHGFAVIYAKVQAHIQEHKRTVPLCSVYYETVKITILRFPFADKCDILLA